MCVTGGRHYFDRLCSDRRYSDNLQSGRHSSTSLVCLDVEIVEIGKKLEWVEALDASKARHWSRRWGDWGERSLGRVSQCSGVPPPSEKLQRTSNTIVLPLIFGIWFGVLPIGTARRPIQPQSTTRRPDCAWTVGIASVGTESVGIVWCTPSALLFTAQCTLVQMRGLGIACRPSVRLSVRLWRWWIVIT